MDRILIVDDETKVRRGLRTTLTSAGFTVSSARSGREALSRQEDAVYDAVVMDMRMRPLDGVETTLRLQEADPQLSVVAHTAFANDYRSRAKRDGARVSAWIEKPVISSKKTKAFLDALRQSSSETRARRLMERLETARPPASSRTRGRTAQTPPTLHNLLKDLRRSDPDALKLALLHGAAELLTGAGEMGRDVARAMVTELGDPDALLGALRGLELRSLAEGHERDLRELVEMEATLKDE